VGAMNKIERDMLRVKVVTSMLDASYNLRGETPQQGFNCVSYLHWYYEQQGYKMPRTLGECSDKNYISYWERSPRQAKITLLRHVKRLGVTLDSSFCIVDDIVLLKGKDEIMNAVYLGRGKFLSCDMRIGIVVIPQQALDCEIAGIIRPKLEEVCE
jgi:hypothetical protein